MPRRALLTCLAILSAALLSAAWPPPSGASSTDLARCHAEPALSCGALPVPLDRSGAVPGTITLSFARKLAGGHPSSSALLVLAGGPGQAALPFAEFAATAMAPALHTRDLLVFDQRGTGDSDPLSCPALEAPGKASPSHLLASCAEQIGPARGAFTTQESVSDIEALRQALGYQKLVLYGTSYGTKLALEYAERYPQNVEALVLDSVVPTDGPEPFAIPTFEAVGAVVKELCTQNLCAGITPEPLADLTDLIARLRVRPLRGSVYDGYGHRHASSIGEAGLLGVLEAGDLNPALRALLPAAVRSALTGEPDPLLRLQALSEGLVPNVPGTRHEEGDEDEALFVTTTCEEAPFPWKRTSSPAGRLDEALAYLGAQPASDFAPFDARTALQTSLVEACDAWPYASVPPPAPAPLPEVPTLILSGAQDLRTPTSDARGVAAAIPGSQLLVVPFTGHSVVGSDLTGCVAPAIEAFFSGRPVQPCAAAHDVLAPTPLSPRSLASIRPPAKLGGRPGRTLVAALDTLLDLDRQVIAATLQASAALPSGARFGGLHGGFARISTHVAVLDGFSFVPGVTLTGTFPISHGRLQTSTVRVGGRAASPGTIRVGATARRVSGTLGGRRFDMLVGGVHLSRAAGGEWPSAQALLAQLGPRVGSSPARLP